MKIALTVNGRPVVADVAPRTSLADFLRDHLLLTGTHIGCEHGICGACTIEIGGEIARSCITLAAACNGASVRTIEGFDEDALMRDLRGAFTEAHALQCGYCTPGMLIAARDLVRRKRGLSRESIRLEMSGNLCRCTGYMGIVDAIARVMAERPHAEQPLAPARRQWLGPEPGPVAAAGAPREKLAAAAPSKREPPQPRPMARRQSTPIPVAVGSIEEAGDGVRLAQWFRLEHPREAVWRLMSDPEALVGCMPGARLDGPPDHGRITGRVEVRLGPVAAAFAGNGSVQSFPAEFRQVIEGTGGDRTSGSRVSGSVDYRLTAIPGPSGDEATKVDVVIAYALTGLLAQFGRSNLARDLAARMGEVFAQNLDARLRGLDATPTQQAPIRALSLALQLIAARLRRLLSRILGT